VHPQLEVGFCLAAHDGGEMKYGAGVGIDHAAQQLPVSNIAGDRANPWVGERFGGHYVYQDNCIQGLVELVRSLQRSTLEELEGKAPTEESGAASDDDFHTEFPER